MSTVYVINYCYVFIQWVLGTLFTSISLNTLISFIFKFVMGHYVIMNMYEECSPYLSLRMPHNNYDIGLPNGCCHYEIFT